MSELVGPTHERRRLSIIREAAQVFAEHGFNAGTTREIAGRLGLTQPAIYHYLGSKERILVEILRRVADDMDSALRRGLESSTDPVVQLRAVLAAFTEAVLADRAGFAVYWNDFRSLPSDIQRELKERERAFVMEVTTLVGRAQQVADFARGDPPAVVAEAMLGMVSWSYHWYRPEGALPASEISGVFARLLGLEEQTGG